MATTTNTRLKPLNRNTDFATGLQARIHDPLWLLSRQWQIGEFQAEDAGSPISARIRLERAPVSRYFPGPLAKEETVAGQVYDSEKLPLEALVEREKIRKYYLYLSTWKIAAEAGLQFLRLLDAFGLSHYREGYRKQYALALPSEEALSAMDPPSRRFIRIMAGRAPNGIDLYREHRHNLLENLPKTLKDPVIEPDDVKPFIKALEKWFVWYENLFSEPQNDQSPWMPDRMEYAFSISANTSSGEKVLTAAEYQEGHLDWYAFNLQPRASLGGSSDNKEVAKVVQTTIPSPVSYPGMPAPRWWEFEDAEVNFGDLHTERTDLIKLVFMDLVLTYGNDWFLIPLELTPGSIYQTQSLVVTDTFGHRTLIRPYYEIDGPASHWRLFCPGINRYAKVNGNEIPEKLFFLPPIIGASLQSPPIEEVHFLRDEMANLAWAVERLVESPIGRPLNRNEQYQENRRKAKAERETGSSSKNAPVVYRLATKVPEHWIPLVPVRIKENGAAGNGKSHSIRLVRGRVLGEEAGQIILPKPQGNILEPEKQLRLFDEEIPRSGVRVTRSYQYARWMDGSTHLWIGRRKTPGRGEGWSGLRFDVLEEK